MIRNNKTSKTIERPAPQIRQLKFVNVIEISIKNTTYRQKKIKFYKRIKILGNLTTIWQH